MASDVIKEDDAEVGSAVAFTFTQETRTSIINSIRLIDDTETIDLLPDDAALGEIRDYATKSAFKTLKNGNTVKVRGPLANSLEDYIRDFVRIGKVKWVTVIDKRTGERDRELNGTIWNANDTFAPLPPLHPHCRCNREPVTDNSGAYK